ncbi:Rpn family recombination-promoting nuclease/putative transposase [Candidatus Tisiphia endosymbiont of Parasteatoda lunata]|uniref:Rpn family recombination-promoting nuclease/putative transposase n=1 Tax=Candidatus Tisiphia endosymbiont of Parasteatoda lunata TaxID=3066275 RepID=UPI00313AB676
MAITKFLDPKNDVAFRRIFGSEKNKDILIHFINDVLELKGSDRIKEVTFLPTIQEPEIASKKQSIVDVLCKDENGVQLIIEMQVSPQEGFEKRAQYYAAKAYSRQLNKGKKEGARYIDLKAVIFIAISDNIIFKDKVFYKSDHIILDKDSYAHDLKDFSFTFIELPKFKITDINLLTNIIEKWCYFFKHADETSESDLRKIIGSDQVIERAYEELNQFNWTEEELLTYEQETKRIMDNKAAEDYLIESAKAEGKAEGIEIGETRGIQIGKAELVKILLQNGNSVESIAKMTDMSIKEIKELLNIQIQ